MSGRTQLMWDEAVTAYDFGPDHPMDPVRLALTWGLVGALGLDRAVEVVTAKPAGESTLRLVHRQDYIDAVKTASADPHAADRGVLHQLPEPTTVNVPLTPSARSSAASVPDSVT